MSIVITQGDELSLTLTCTDHDLTGATLTTYLPKTDGTTLTLANGVHTIDADQVTNKGKFTVALTAAETALLKEGAYQDIITKVSQGGTIRHYHGKGLLQVKDADVTD
jgi:hypothetical protein